MLHISIYNFWGINSKGLGEKVAFHCVPKFVGCTHVLFPVWVLMYGTLLSNSWTSVSKTVEVISRGQIARNCVVNICVTKLTLPGD